MKENQTMVKETLLIFLRAIAAYPSLMYQSLLLPLANVLLSVAVPFYASKVLASLAQQDATLTRSIVLLAICSVAGIIANRIGFCQLMVVHARSLADMHQMVFERLLSRSVGYHNDRISGKLISDVIEFTSAFGVLVSVGYINSVGFALSLLIGLVVVFISSWQLGLLLFVIVAVVIAWAAIESRTRSMLRYQRLKATKKLTAHLSDSIVNTQTVKTFGQEKVELEQNRKLNQKLSDLRVRDWQRAGRSGSNRSAALLAMQLCLILFVVYLTRKNPAALGAGIFAFTYTLALSGRLFEINNITRQIEESFLQASPITKMLSEPIEIQDAPHAKNLRVTKGAIAITDVAFAYKEDTTGSTVFNGLTLNVAPGEKIGLVGPSGGGKSTLTRLLLRFDDIQAGSICIDGQNIAEVTQRSLRTAIAYVPQEPLLFHRTVRENIAYGRPDATKAQLIAATKKANAHTFIEALPNGYDTIVGERGVKLSGGQRQRVAIARAILKDAPMLVLDEATSALDSESEVLIQEALWQLMEGRTAIVIAHRLSTIQKMDRIIVLDEGNIVEEGTHQELLQHKGLYAKLWSHQSGGFIED